MYSRQPSRSSSSATLIDEVKYDKDLEEYISNEEEEENSIHRSFKSDSFQVSTDQISRNHQQRLLSLNFLWEYLRKDISEMESTGLFETNSTLRKMVKDIASFEPGIDTNVKAYQNVESKTTEEGSSFFRGETFMEGFGTRSFGKILVGADEIEEWQTSNESDNREQNMVGNQSNNNFSSKLPSSEILENHVNESSINKKQNPRTAYNARKSYKSSKTSQKNDATVRKNNSLFLEDKGQIISTSMKEKEEDLMNGSNFSKSATNFGIEKNVSRDLDDLKCSLQSTIEVATNFQREPSIQEIDIPNTDVTHEEMEIQDLTDELDLIRDFKTYLWNNFHESTESKDASIAEGRSNEYPLQAKHSNDQSREKMRHFSEDSNIIRYFETILWKNYEETDDGQKNVQDLEEWYYDEISDAVKSDANEVNLIQQMESKNVDYPLTRQQMRERDYEIRKKEAWKKWLFERDDKRLQKALLDIKKVMLSQRYKQNMLHRRLKGEEKHEKSKIQNRRIREKEISKRIAIEKEHWKKRMKVWKKIQQEEEAYNARRRNQFRASFLPKFDICYVDKNIRGDNELQITDGDLHEVEKLPWIEFSDSEIINTSSPKKILSSERNNEELVIKCQAEENLAKQNNSATAFEGVEIIKQYLPKYENKMKLFNFLSNSKSHFKNEISYVRGESRKYQSTEKIQMGNFQITPKEIIFKDFIPGMSYHSKVIVQNLDMKSRHLYVIGLWYVDESLSNQGILELDRIGDLPRKFYVKPGLKCHFWINFKPRSVADSTAISAQLVLLTAQRPLQAGVDEWAKLNRASIPDKVRDAGYLFTSITCRDARPEPKVTSSVVIFNYHPYQNENEELVKTIQIVNKGALDCYYRIEKSSDGLGESRTSHEDASEETGTFHNTSSRKSASLPNRPERNVSVDGTKDISRYIKFEDSSSTKISKSESVSNESKSVVEALVKCMTDKATSYVSYNTSLGEVKAHSSTQVKIKLQKRMFSTKHINSKECYSIHFDNNSKTPEIPLWILFHCHKEVEKLIVKKKYIDFGICVAGGVYQDCLEVYNGYDYARGVTLIINDYQNTHMKHIKNPISPHVVEVIPKGITFIQPHFSYQFIVKLTVRKSEESFTIGCDQGNISNENLIFDLKLYTSIPKPDVHEKSESHMKNLLCRIPAFALLSDVAANLKCHPLTLDPPILYLGQCLTTETIKANFKIINNSRIALKYGFLNLPQYITIQPDYGFGEILPKETIQLDLLYSPLKEHGCASPGKRCTFQIKCTDVLNRANPDFTITATMKVEVTVVHIPDIRLSCSLVCFPATACGSFSRATFLLSSIKDLAPQVKAGVHNELLNQNTAHSENPEYSYEFLSQTDEIHVHPQQGFLQLGKTTKINLLFAPKLKTNQILNKARDLWEKSKRNRENTDESQEESREQVKGKAKKKDKKKKNIPVFESKIASLNGPIKAKPNGQTTLATPMIEENVLNEIQPLLIPAETILLQEFKPYVYHSKIACLLFKNQKEDESIIRKTSEMIFIDVVCPITRPGFMILECEEFSLKNQNIKQGNLTESYREGNGSYNAVFNKCKVNYGQVAVNGGKRALAIPVKNISATSLTSIIPTILNPTGPFSYPYFHSAQFRCQPEMREGLPLNNCQTNKKHTSVLKLNSAQVPPDEVLRIPVTFAPTVDGMAQEYLDIRGKTNEGFETQQTIELIGIGEIPKFNLQPNPPVVIVKYNSTKIPKPSVIKVQNLCSASLDFHIGKINITEQENISKINRDSKRNIKTTIKRKEEHEEDKYKYLSNNKTRKQRKYEATAEEMKSESTCKNTHAAEENIHRTENNTQEALKCIYIDPPKFLTVQAHSTGTVTIHLLSSASIQKKIFTFPLALFDEKVANVEVIIK